MSIGLIRDGDVWELFVDDEPVSDGNDDASLEDALIELVEGGDAEPADLVLIDDEGSPRRARLVSLLSPAGRREIGYAIADSAPSGGR